MLLTKLIILLQHRQLDTASMNELNKANNDTSQPYKIPSDCKTRWLPIQLTIENIITQWLELQAHFNIVRLSDKCNTAQLLFR